MDSKRNQRIGLIIGLAFVISMGRHANADYIFGTPTNLGAPVNTKYFDASTSISADGLELYIESDRPGGYGSADIYVARRATKDDPLGEPINLGSTLNSASYDTSPSVSSDGLRLYFGSTRPGGQGNDDLWVAKRATINDPWGEPVNLGPNVNSGRGEWCPSISADGLELYFESNRPAGSGQSDLWLTTRREKDDDWGIPVNLGSVVNTSGADMSPNISSDGLMLFFWSDRPGGPGGYDIWVSTRPTRNEPWQKPMNLGSPVNTSYVECTPDISSDGLTLFFTAGSWAGAGRPGTSGTGDVWKAPITPIVDLNGDGIVDAADMCIMVDHWGTNEKPCDIGPMPWGDGIIDVEDLKVLSNHLFEDVSDPTLITHWPLDEAQGSIAYNSAADCDGTLMGGPVWQPDGGIVTGALQFDGIDDYVSTDFVLNPADGAFSVIVWIKGGIPGQVVFSQADGASWLCTDSVEGCLMTEIKASGRGAPGPLQSQTSITDGQWHRIASVWDGSYRHLYVDGIEVAMDVEPLSELESGEGGLYLGAGKALESGTYFSGLIDDVRIYNRVVTP